MNELLATASPLHLPPSPPSLAVPGLVIVLALDGCWTSQSRFSFLEDDCFNKWLTMLAYIKKNYQGHANSNRSHGRMSTRINDEKRRPSPGRT